MVIHVSRRMVKTKFSSTIAEHCRVIDIVNVDRSGKVIFFELIWTLFLLTRHIEAAKEPVEARHFVPETVHADSKPRNSELFRPSSTLRI
jgi:hypothetical protein